jgi:hypothetical protein
MKIRLRQSQLGMFHGYLSPKRGAVVEADEANALRYIKSGIADPVRDGKVTERAVAPQPETAVLPEVPPSSIPPHPAEAKEEEPKEKPKPLDDDDEPASKPPPRPQPRPAARR